MLLTALCAAPAVALDIGAQEAGVQEAGIQEAGIQEVAQDIGTLRDLSLEQLGNIVVTSVSRRQERLGDAAASIFVITRDDIRRSGAQTLPEALRLAPNLHVARINANQYAITARSGITATSNKLLVLIDGRAVYTPLFAGVFWDAQRVLLEDVARIEVISGPGATMWGANAVHGVINVITHSALETQGALAAVDAGNLGHRAAVRYGGAFGPYGHYRVYAQRERRDPTRASSTAERDKGEVSLAGMRVDWNLGADALTLQGDVYDGYMDQAPQGRTLAGANLLARWTRQFDRGASLSVQAYLDRTRRDVPGEFYETLTTADLDVQHALAPAGGHSVLWGFSYRHARDDVTASTQLAFLPARRDLEYVQLFAQDEVALTPRATLTLGWKLAHNPYSGTDTLPSMRIAYKDDADTLWWAALSRAARAPSRIDRDFFVPAAPPYVVAGGPEFRSEVAKTLEAGVRGQRGMALSYTLTAFYHRYAHLRTVEPGAAGLVLRNNMRGSTLGAEAWAHYQVSPTWQLSAGATVREIDRELAGGSRDTQALTREGNDPSHTVKLRSSWNLAHGQWLDASVRRIGALPSPAVPAYTAMDLGYGWRVRPDLEWSLTVQNLFNRRHVEWRNATAQIQVERGIHARVVWTR